MHSGKFNNYKKIRIIVHNMVKASIISHCTVYSKKHLSLFTVGGLVKIEQKRCLTFNPLFGVKNGAYTVKPVKRLVDR